MNVLEIVKTKLQTIDNECESKARAQLHDYYESAKYNGTRLLVPSFQEVGTVWLKLIEEKEHQSLDELSKVLSHPNSEINSKCQIEIVRLIEQIFSESRYIDRLDVFSEGITRKALSYGIQFNPSVYGYNAHNGAYQAGAKNALRKARKGLNAEILLHSQPSTPETIKNLKIWQTYIRLHPLQSFVFMLILVCLALLSSIGLPDIVGWITGPTTK